MIKKLKLQTWKDLYFTIGVSIYCDFCGEKDKEVFTSSYDDNDDSRKCETQICKDCVRQLSKFI